MGWLPSPTGGPTAATAAAAAADDEVTLSAEPKLVPTAGDSAASTWTAAAGVSVTALLQVPDSGATADRCRLNMA